MVTPIISISPRSGSASHAPGFTLDREASADINLHVLLAGSIRYRWPGGSASARVGAMVALPIGLRFRQTDGILGEGVRLSVIHAQARGLPPWPQSIQVRRQAVHQFETMAIARALARAADAWKDGHAGAELEVQGLGQALIMRWYHQQPIKQSPDEHWVAPVLAAIEADFADPSLDVATLAALAKLSRAHFSRRFAIAVGYSPGRYLERRRLRHAQHLLAHGVSVAAAAEACGYRDAFHFSRVFKRCKGVPPSQWSPPAGREA
ncbi:MAG: AraC family transcriptional regulator [Planctomycetota bacterium]|nr:MAG: AraC family transcriptional regulator [Planctomycetota bacterium]